MHPLAVNRELNICLLMQVWQAWMLSPHCPHLYLYSSCDALIPPAEVTRFMNMQADRGIQVHSKQWHDSPHCEHLRWHRDEYASQMNQFLKNLQP